MCSLSPKFVLNVLKSGHSILKNKNIDYISIKSTRMRAVRTVGYGPLDNQSEKLYLGYGPGVTDRKKIITFMQGLSINLYGI